MHKRCSTPFYTCIHCCKNLTEIVNIKTALTKNNLSTSVVCFFTFLFWFVHIYVNEVLSGKNKISKCNNIFYFPNTNHLEAEYQFPFFYFITHTEYSNLTKWPCNILQNGNDISLDKTGVKRTRAW